MKPSKSSRVQLGEASCGARRSVALAYVLVCVLAVWLVVPSVGLGQGRSWSGRGLVTGLDRAGSRLAGGMDLRASLSGSFASVELGAPPSVLVGAHPSGVAVSEATHTVYAVNQGDDTVSVIDARACNAGHPSGCGQALATIRLGPGGLMNGPVAAILARDGETLYVASPAGENAVAVVDAATCNATRTSGCARGPVARVATGQTPVAVVEDPRTHTLYVANVFGNTVSVINAGRCNADRTAGCGEAPATVPVGTGPSALALDSETHTVYVANVDDNTVSVINAARCNGQQTAGCWHTPAVQAVGGGPAAIGVSRLGDTVYVGNGALNRAGALVPNGNTVSVIDGAACNAEHPQGCSAVPPPAIPVGGEPAGQPQSLAVDQKTHDVYVSDSKDDTMSVIDGARCNARNVTGCAHPAPTVQTGAEPVAIAVVQSVHTVYVDNAVDGAVSVIDKRVCTDEHPMGCRPAPAPTAPLAPNDQLSFAAIDAAYHTAYVTNYGLNFAGPFVLDLINTSKCNAGNRAGCNPQPPLPTVPTPGGANGVAVDPSTNTLYVSEGGNGPPAVLEVIDAATCNATVSSCANTATVALGGSHGGGPVRVDPATHTVYVGGPSDISVIDARHCNAADLTGCATQTPATIPVGPAASFAVAPNTLYAAVQPNFDATIPGRVDVIDTRHCRAADTSQCATQTPPAVTVGAGPSDTAMDLAHHTLYVPDNANGDSRGLLSMINTTRCNGENTSDCTSQTPPTTPMRRAPLAATLDPFTSTLYVTNFSNASASLIYTATCNATTQAGCRPVPPQVVTGSGPDAAALDPAAHTMYVPNFFDGTASIIRTDNPPTPSDDRT